MVLVVKVLIGGAVLPFPIQPFQGVVTLDYMTLPLVGVRYDAEIPAFDGFPMDNAGVLPLVEILKKSVGLHTYVGVAKEGGEFQAFEKIATVRNTVLPFQEIVTVGNMVLPFEIVTADNVVSPFEEVVTGGNVVLPFVEIVTVDNMVPFEEDQMEGAGILPFEMILNMCSRGLPFEGDLGKVQSSETPMVTDEIQSFAGIQMKDLTMKTFDQVLMVHVTVPPFELSLMAVVLVVLYERAGCVPTDPCSTLSQSLVPAQLLQKPHLQTAAA